MDIKNQTGQIEASVRGNFKYQAVEKEKKGKKAKVEIKMMRNPMDEIQYFQSQIIRKLNKKELTIHPIVVFPDASTLTWKDGKIPDLVAVIHRKQVYQTMKEIHEKKADVFSESEIEHMYLALAGEVLEAEKNKRFGFRKKEV